MSDTEEPKKPTQTKKSMDAPSAPSSSQSPKSSDNMSSGLENITKKLDEIKTADESQRAEIKDGIDNLAGSLSKDKPTKEEETEKKKSFSKAFQKLGDTIKKSFGGSLKGLGMILSGTLGPLKKFWDAVKKVKGFILAFLGVFLLKDFTIKDVKEMWKGMKKFFLQTKKLFITITKSMEPLVQWFKEDAVPSAFGAFTEVMDSLVKFMEPIVDWFVTDFVPETFTLFISTLDNLSATFTKLTADFKGFTDKSWKDKMTTIITALETVGTFTTNFFGDVVDWVFRLMGYDGSITKNLRGWLEKTFSKEFMDNVMVIFTTIVGAMTVARVFGMSPVIFLKVFGGMIFSAVRTLFAVVYGAINPVTLTIGLLALTAYYHEEIFSALDSVLMTIGKWFENLGIMANNAMAKTKIGKFLGLEEKEFTTKEEDEAKKNKMQRDNLAKAEAELKRLEDWKFLSEARPGEVEGELFDDSSSWYSQSEDMSALQKAKNEVKLWKGKVAAQEKDDGHITLHIKPGGISQSSIPELKNQINASLAVFDELSGDKTIGFEGAGKPGRPGFSYDDTKGNRTIGFGFNMDKPNAEDVMKKAGISKNWDDLYSGKIALTKEERFKLKNFEMGYFRNSAKNWIGAEKWAKMNVGAQRALTDMAYNMGGNFTGKNKDGTFKWKDLRNALIDENMAFVGPAIKDSDYFGDVQKERSLHNIAMLSNAYAVPSQLYKHDLSPSKERIAKEPAIKVESNPITVNEGDSFLSGDQSPRQGGGENPFAALYNHPFLTHKIPRY